MDKKKYLQEITAKKGEEWVKKNKKLLDAQWEYILTLGDPNKK